MGDYRLRLIEDHINMLLHGEGYHLRLFRHDAEDLVTILLERVTLGDEHLGDQCPRLRTKRIEGRTVTEGDLRGD